MYMPTSDDVEQYNGMILSYGAGVNSTALAILLVKAGWKGEIVFADTGCEWPDTYCFMQFFEREWLKPRGFSITKLKGLPWQRRGKGLGLLEYCEQQGLVPMAAMRWCTQCWKIDPLNKYRAWREALIGIASDEAHRQKGRICPLIDWGVDRQGCKDIITAEGLPVPRKSGCFICPFQRNSQWYQLYMQYPDLYARAERLEMLASTKANRRVTIDIHDLSLSEKRAKFEAGIIPPDDDYTIYQPCVCADG